MIEKITQNILKTQLNYDPLTGIFTRLVSNNFKCKVGEVAGSLTNKGYISIWICGKSYMAHRLAWLYIHGYMPSDCIDHINGVTNDNRLINLREASFLQNARHTKVRKDNTTGFKGVSFHKKIKKFSATISVQGDKIHLGYFNQAEDAYSVYVSASKYYFAEFHKNIII